MKDRDYLRNKVCGKILQTNRPKKQSGVVTLISSKIDLQLKIKRGEGGSFMLIKGKIHPDDGSILTIYSLNIKFENESLKSNHTSTPTH